MKNFWNKIKSITPGTWIRTALLVLALVNQLLTMIGKSPLPISDEQLTEALSLAFTIAASLAAWWKNNSFSDAALAADEYMHTLKNDE